MQLHDVIGASVTLLLIAAPLGAAQAKIHAQWVQLGPDGTASARAITDEACPAVFFDGARVAMSTRSEPGQPFGNVKPAEFLVRGCEVAVPLGAAAATIDGKPLPIPKEPPRRIMMFGDTGCRLKGTTVQDCNDPNDWPFAKIIAAAAAAQPDLVIHVGDYHYREDACPIDRRGCAGSPFGYGFDAWNADFFEPAGPLLAAAPWIMVRGNHEDCGRAGEGWFRFLDRAPMESSCRDLTGVFVAKLGELGVVVADGAAAADPRGDARPMEDLLRRQFDEVADKVPAEAWFVTHRPLNAMSNYGGPDVIENKVLEHAFGPAMPPGVRMSVAGHVHMFQAVDFGGARPPQLVVGTGGDTLDLEPMSAIGADINGQRVVSSVTRAGFGYMIWEREGVDWIGTLYDVDAKPLDHCRLVARSLKCGQ